MINADGTVTDTWSDPSGNTVVVSGDAGSVVHVSPVTTSTISSGHVSHTWSINIAPPSPPKGGVNAAKRGELAYANSGQSVLKEAIAVGMDPTAAFRLYGTAPSSAASTAPSVASANSGPIWKSWCASLNSSDGHVHSYACDVERIAYQSGSNWYVTDQMTDSGYSNNAGCCFGESLTQLVEAVVYSSGNQLVTWSPTSARYAPSSCTPITVSVSTQYGSVSEANEICSDWIGPWTIQNLEYGTMWNGTEPQANWYESTEGVDMFHSPPGACTCTYLHVGMSWN